jgi:UDP-N-acetylmuramate dehydrogenase
VGGPADALARPASRSELQALVRWCVEHEVPLLVLGGGFNTLVRDSGVRGVVVQLHALRKIERDRDGRLVAEAGATHSSTCRYAAQQGLAGLEFGVGIPGTVGGWLAMNAGIGAREMVDLVESIEWLEASGELRSLPASELRFDYRALERPPGTLLLAARLRTEPDDPAAIRARMRAFLDARRDSQPIDERSCGSVFRNPPGDYAGRLIEAAGLKGRREAGAMISTVHANFIVNAGRATASDVLRLIEVAKTEVAERFGVELDTEVQIVGEPT